MDVTAHLASMPAEQVALLVVACLVMVVGGNGAFVMHYRRVGKPVWRSLMDPVDFPLLRFKAREWLLLVGSVAAFVGLVWAALGIRAEA